MKRNQNTKERASRFIEDLWPLIPACLFEQMPLGSKTYVLKHPWCSSTLQKVLLVTLYHRPKECAVLLLNGYGFEVGDDENRVTLVYNAVRSVLKCRIRALQEQEAEQLKNIIASLPAPDTTTADGFIDERSARLVKLSDELVEKVKKSTAFLVDLEKKEPVFFKACRDNVLRTLVTEVRRAVDKVIEEDVINA